MSINASITTSGGRARTGHAWAKVSLVLFIVVIFQLLFDYKTVRGKSPREIPKQPQYSSSSQFMAELAQHTDEWDEADGAPQVVDSSALFQSSSSGSSQGVMPSSAQQQEPPPPSTPSDSSVVMTPTVETPDQKKVASSNDNNNLPPPPFSNDLIQQARSFLESRRRAYQEIGLLKNWHLRGIAYLAEHQDMLLAGEWRLPMTDSDSNTKGQVIIRNVHPKGLEQATTGRRDCHLLEVWVRVRGPEVFAGGATAVNPDNESEHCYWVFDFDLQVSGDYVVESKVLLWNGKIDFNGSNTCKINKGNVSAAIEEQFPVHIGFRGFKLYGADKACCEFCSRQRNPPCRYWASPPVKLKDPAFMTNGCEFYFDEGTQEEDFPFLSPILGDLKGYNWTGFNKVLKIKKRDRILRQLTDLGQYFSYWREQAIASSQRHRRLGGINFVHGYPHDGPTPYFVGCGWHQMFTLDFPCISGELDDKVVLAQETFLYQRPTPPVPRSEPLPLCQHKDELLKNHRGRYVKEPWPNATVCPMPFEFDLAYEKRNKVTMIDPDHPHCWHRDDLTIVGYSCGEMNCHFIWEDSRWKSGFREKEFMSVWRQYDCDYYEYTDNQLQQCIDTKKISEFKFDGASVASAYKRYVEQRLQTMKLYSASLPDATTVTLSTLALLHKSLLLDEDLEKEWRKKYKDMKDRPNEMVYIANAFYLTSERETFCFVDRMRRFNSMVEDHFLPKGYHILNAFDASQAVSYDTAGQFDGMHLNGPPMKTIVTKLFHYICQDVVDGSRL